MAWRASAALTVVASTALALSVPHGPAGRSPVAETGSPRPALSAVGSSRPAASTAGPPSPAPTPGLPAPRRPRFSPQREWPLAALRADELWQRTLGAGVTVAVVDTGIDRQQPDLATAVSFVTDLETGASRDDGSDVSDDSHGTAVAGIIAGRGSAADQNHMAGLAPRASLIDIRVAVQPGRVNPGTVAQGIRKAVQSGADIINISLEVPTGGPSLQSAVSFAVARHCLVVAGAGSSQAPQALADYPGVITVAATDRAAGPTPAAVGPVTVSAPGADLFSAGEMNGAGSAVGGYVRHVSGSGYAAAYVSAAAALLISADQNLSPAKAGRLLVTTARPTASRSSPAVIDPIVALNTVLRQSPRRPGGTKGHTAKTAAGPGGDGSPLDSFGLRVSAALTLVVLCASGFVFVRRRRAVRSVLSGFQPSSWDQPW